MIKKLEINNFQGHRKSVLNLHEGVNVIKGSSHGGKTAIIRALSWVFLNRPRGVQFKSWGASKKDAVKVKVTLDNSVIIRKRDNSFNGYVLPSTKLNAVGADVPEEVTNLTQMDSLNIQMQHDSYFMLQDTPGNVAKMLNEAVEGLELIDVAIGNANKKINKTSTDISHAKANVGEFKTEVSRFGFLKKVEPVIENIQETLIEDKETSERLHNLEQLLNQIEEIKETRDKSNEWLKIEKPYTQIVNILYHFNTLNDKADRLSKALDLIKALQNELSEFEVYSELESHHKSIDNLLTSLNDSEEKLELLTQVCDDISNYKKELKVAQKQVKIAQDMYDKAIESMEMCPLCKQPIKKGR